MFLAKTFTPDEPDTQIWALHSESCQRYDKRTDGMSRILVRTLFLLFLRIQTAKSSTHRPIARHVWIPPPTPPPYSSVNGTKFLNANNNAIGKKKMFLKNQFCSFQLAWPGFDPRPSAPMVCKCHDHNATTLFTDLDTQYLLKYSFLDKSSTVRIILTMIFSNITT